MSASTSLSNTYTLRLYQPADLSAITTINALANTTDPLTKYLRPTLHAHWFSYRQSCLRFLRAKVLSPGTVCVVVVDVDVVVGWAIYTRHGADATPARHDLCHRLERALRRVEEAYFTWVPGVDPSRAAPRFAQLMPILRAPWPADLFGAAGFWTLDALCVHPDHGRRGVGRRLTLWGVGRGDEEGVPVLVHASPTGRRLYESVGFAVLRRMARLDEWVPDFKGRAPDGDGCWDMCWQPAGTEWVRRARERMHAGEQGGEGEASFPARRWRWSR